LDTFGWLDCKGVDCKKILPKNHEILYWDENFQTRNVEVVMTKIAKKFVTVNSITARLQHVSLDVQTDRIQFGLPLQSSGFTLIAPPGVSYQIQWNFASPNLVDPDDSFCHMRWDEDFSQIYTQYTAIDEMFSDADKISGATLSEYLYDEADESDISLTFILSAYHWGEAGIQK
jgi:hypothetical protein